MANGMNVNLQSKYQASLTLFNESVTADTDILTNDIEVGDESGQFDFTKGMSVTFEGAFEAVGNLYFVVKNAALEEAVIATNGGYDSSNENAGFTFNFTLPIGYSLNIRYTASTTLNWLTITVHGGKI